MQCMWGSGGNMFNISVAEFWTIEEKSRFDQRFLVKMYFSYMCQDRHFTKSEVEKLMFKCPIKRHE